MKKTLYPIVTFVLLSLVIVFSKINHLNIGVFNSIIPVLYILNLFIILYLLYKKNFTNLNLFVFGIVLNTLFFSCKEQNNTTIVPNTNRLNNYIASERKADPNLGASQDEISSFLKEYNLKETKSTARQDRRFNDFSSFKKCVMELTKDAKNKTKRSGMEKANVIGTSNSKNNRTENIEDVPCSTNNYNYTTNSSIYDYEGGADLNINLTYSVNSSGQYTNTNVQVSQFGIVTDGFSSTTPSVTENSTTGDIAMTFTTTQTNTINLGLWNYSTTTITYWSITYNPCGTPGNPDKKIRYDFEFNEM